MVRKLLILLCVAPALQCAAQQRHDFAAAGLLKANLALMQGFMIQHPAKNVYLGGNMEYFPSSNLSIRGDCMWYLDSRNTASFNQNGIVLFGPILHMPSKRSDFYAGIQPGFSLTTPAASYASTEISLTGDPYPPRFLPAVSLSSGYTLYFSRFCNFYVGLNYIVSRYRGATNGSLNFDELTVSAGLGFHLFIVRQTIRYH